MTSLTCDRLTAPFPIARAADMLNEMVCADTLNGLVCPWLADMLNGLVCSWLADVPNCSHWACGE